MTSKTQESTESVKKNWIIPRERTCLRTVLESCDFAFGDGGSIYGKPDHYTPKRNRNKLGEYVGDHRTIDHITLMYAQSNIEDVLTLRGILDLNDITYQEQPLREEFAKQLREKSRGESSLADLIESKQNPVKGDNE